MDQNKINIAILLGDPSGIGPELVSKLLSENITNKANIVVIGEKKVLESGDKITNFSNNLKIVNDFDEINFQNGNKFFLDITKGKNHDYKLSECSKEAGESVLSALNLPPPVTFSLMLFICTAASSKILAVPIGKLGVLVIGSLVTRLSILLTTIIASSIEKPFSPLLR